LVVVPAQVTVVPGAGLAAFTAGGTQLALAAELATSATSKTAAAGKTARIRLPNAENENP
jgi:hypothetical protein